MKIVKRRGQRGQSMVEYVLIFTVILAALIAAIPAFKTEIGKLFTSAKNQVNKASAAWDAKQ